MLHVLQVRQELYLKFQASALMCHDNLLKSIRSIYCSEECSIDNSDMTDIEEY